MGTTLKVYCNDQERTGVVVHEPVRTDDFVVALNLSDDDITLLDKDGARVVLRGLMAWQIDQLEPQHFVRRKLEEALAALEGR
jgi:hypothetical protein